VSEGDDCVEDEWLALPQIAHELGIADSTARRWAILWPEWVKTRGHGSGRRFHQETREFFARVQTLYDKGYTKEQITEVLRREFSATVEAVTVPEPTLSPAESALLALAEGLQTALQDMEARITGAHRAEVASLKAEIADLRVQLQIAEDTRRHDAANHDAELMLKIRLAVQTTMEEHTPQGRRSWWPWKR
jgi:DNA-binding transcriptional MerR regulator